MTEQRRLSRPTAWGLGLALGVGVGVALGAALGNIGVGFALGVGVAFALAFGAGSRKPRNDNSGPTGTAPDDSDNSADGGPHS